MESGTEVMAFRLCYVLCLYPITLIEQSLIRGNTMNHAKTAVAFRYVPVIRYKRSI